jgi:hypothetical protein
MITIVRQSGKRRRRHAIAAGGVRSATRAFGWSIRDAGSHCMTVRLTATADSERDAGAAYLVNIAGGEAMELRNRLNELAEREGWDRRGIAAEAPGREDQP